MACIMRVVAVSVTFGSGTFARITVGSIARLVIEVVIAVVTVRTAMPCDRSLACAVVQRMHMDVR